MTMTPEQIAAALVANGYAHRLPTRKTRCMRTIELKAVPDNWGRMYIKPDGEVRVGFTLRDSQRVAPAFRRQVVGEP